MEVVDVCLAFKADCKRSGVKSLFSRELCPSLHLLQQEDPAEFFSGLQDGPVSGQTNWLGRDMLLLLVLCPAA